MHIKTANFLGSVPAVQSTKKPPQRHDFLTLEKLLIHTLRRNGAHIAQ